MVIAGALAALVLLAAPLPGAGSRPQHWRPGAHNARHAICTVFSGYCVEALRVAECETGGTWSVWARNGQYRGLFQMGSWERRRYGHGTDPWAQARAARRYFIATARTWRPWPECRWRVPRIRAGG